VETERRWAVVLLISKRRRESRREWTLRQHTTEGRSLEIPGEASDDGREPLSEAEMVASEKATSKCRRVLTTYRKIDCPPGGRSVSRNRGDPDKPGDGRQQSPKSCDFHWSRPVELPARDPHPGRGFAEMASGGDTGCFAGRQSLTQPSPWMETLKYSRIPYPVRSFLCEQVGREASSR